MCFLVVIIIVRKIKIQIPKVFRKAIGLIVCHKYDF